MHTSASNLATGSLNMPLIFLIMVVTYVTRGHDNYLSF